MSEDTRGYRADREGLQSDLHNAHELTRNQPSTVLCEARHAKDSGRDRSTARDPLGYCKLVKNRNNLTRLPNGRNWSSNC